jgi:hypothetical protein
MSFQDEGEPGILNQKPISFEALRSETSPTHASQLLITQPNNGLLSASIIGLRHSF